MHLADTEPPAATAEGYTRLHITPLDTDLVSVVIPAATLPQARNLSYHTLETFPEKRYGFVDLPVADAEKLKNKLNGAVLRGVKIRVEMARREKILEPAVGEEAMPKEKKQKKSKSQDDDLKKEKRKKRKRDGQEVAGVELEDGRKVKRGWTVSETDKIKRKDKSKKDSDKEKKREKKSEKKRESRSKYTDKPECLIKTVLPPNVASTFAVDAAGEPTKKKGKNDRPREVTIHEFERTTKFPTFLKSAPETVKSGPNLEYVEGAGWANEKGDVVDAVQPKQPREVVLKKTPRKKSAPQPKVDEDDTTSSDGTSSDDTSSEESDSDSEEQANTAKDAQKTDSKRGATPEKENTVEQSAQLDSPRPKSSSSARSLTIKIPPVTPAAPKTVHPLETLYKKTAATPGRDQPEESAFSFFGAGDADDIEDGDDLPPSQPPMTPFSKMDFETRNLRSAAPTPDTAHANKHFNFWPQDEEEDEEEDEHEEAGQDTLMADAAATNGTDDKEEGAPRANPSTDFDKWFWESRGDNNRSWKKRRKATAKEKRYRENRARSGRAI